MLPRFIEPLESRQLLSAVDPVINLKIVGPSTNTLLAPARPYALVVDSKRNQLVAIEEHSIRRFDMSDGSLVGVFGVNGSVVGGDITMDGSFLYVCDSEYSTVYKVDLSTGAFNRISDVLTPGAFVFPREVAIRQTEAIVSEPFKMGYSAYIRIINTENDFVRTPLTSSGDPLMLDQDVLVARSADYNSVALVSSTSEFSYTQSGFAGRTQLNFGRIAALAVSRNGALHAIATASAVIVEDQQFQTIKEIPIAVKGLAFDPSADVLYVADPSADLIRAYDTQSWNELYSIAIGEDLQDVGPYGAGDMAVSGDGSSIFVITESGVRWLRFSGAISTFGDAVRFQADVSADGSTSGAPTGSVTFIDSQTDQALGQGTLEDGQAILTLSNIHAGAHSIFARYSGDSNYNAADSSPVPLNIQRAFTTASLTSLDLHTATIKITSSAGVPEGGTTSIWYDGKITATADVHAGAATLQHHLPLVNDDGMYLRYSGNSDFLPTNDFVIFSVRDTSTTTISGPASADSFSPIRIVARVSTSTGAPVNSGMVYFMEGEQIIGSSPVISGRADTFYHGAPLGLHSFFAKFTGNPNLQESVSKPLNVKVIPAATTLKLTAPSSYAPKGQRLSFSATLSNHTPVEPTGLVQFKEGKRVLGTAGVQDGTAFFNTTALRVGNHSITATYLGDENFKGSTSAAVKVSVVSVTTVDLMIVYTAQARDDEGDIKGTVSKAVSDTNLALWNSHIPVMIRLVYSGLVDYRESGKFHTDLKRLVLPRDGYMDSVHQLRNTYGADLVSLFVHDGDLGGVGFELQDIRDRGNSRLGFSVVWAPHSGAPDFYLAHELGHNFGASHDIQHDPDTAATSFSSGWRFRAQGHLYHDIMSYDPGTTIPYFSNPRIKYRGVPTGSDDADAARTITLTAATVAAYRKAK